MTRTPCLLEGGFITHRAHTWGGYCRHAVFAWVGVMAEVALNPLLVKSHSSVIVARPVQDTRGLCTHIYPTDMANCTIIHYNIITFSSYLAKSFPFLKYSC